MLVLIPAVVAAATLSSPARAEPVGEAALKALTQVCLPASETSTAARDLALAQGWSRDARAPEALAKTLPLAALSASFTVPSDGGEVHVVSTVMPPPASPYSCAVAVSSGAPELTASLEAPLSAAGYRRSAEAPSGPGRMIEYRKAAGGGIDRVVAQVNWDGAGGVLLVAYRFGPWRPAPGAPERRP